MDIIEDIALEMLVCPDGFANIAHVSKIPLKFGMTFRMGRGGQPILD
jgi:hypothetical protein